MGSSRRDLFRQLAGQATRRRPRSLAVGPAPVQRPLGAFDLRRLADRHGLAAVADDVVALSRATVRLVPTDASPEGASRLFPAPDDAVADDVLEIATLRGDVLAAVGLALPLGAATLSLSLRLPESVGEHEPGPLVCGPALAVVGPPAVHEEDGVPPELTLPRVWSAPVQALDLDEAATVSWELLRAAMATAQGTSPPDEAASAVHRVLGYPDERRGLMPALCAERSGASPEQEGGAPEHWRLLLQASTAGLATVPSALTDRERVYFWIADGALARGDLSSIVAIAQ